MARTKKPSTPNTTKSQITGENHIPKEIQNAQQLKELADQIARNGLGDAIGFPNSQTSPWAEQISQSTTLFKNLRWYFVSNLRQLLSELYVEIGLVSTIVDVPVDDALRGGIKIKSKQLDESQILELVTSMDRDNDLMNVGQAEKWNRLFGGAGILIMTDQDPMTPLDLNAINMDEPLEFRPVDMWELFWDKQNTEGYDPEIQTQNFEFYNYYAKQIHKSRVIRLKGLNAPSFLRPRLRGWGFSVVERLVRSINQYLKATDLAFEVMDEFKLDVYKLKNLTNALMSPIGSNKIKERVAMANWQKNYQNAIVLDTEDDFDHKQLSFSGLSEAMEGIRMQVASDMRFPITKLFGTSASKGFATDQNDMEVYNSMVESEVRNKIKYAILRVIEIRCQQHFGFIPDDISIEFNSLRVLSAVDEEAVKTSKFNRLMMAKQAGEITTLEFRESINKDNLLSISLDNAGDELNPLDPEIARLVEGEPDPYHTTDVDDPGANREDTRKPRAWDTETGEKQEVKTTENEKIEKVEKAEKLEKAKETTIKGLAPKLPKTTQNDLSKMTDIIKPFSITDLLARKLSNSIAFDKASYEADGGDDWMPEGREKLFENPGSVDEALWSKAKEASQAAFGKIKYPFVVWWYKKQGGKFSKL